MCGARGDSGIWAAGPPPLPSPKTEKRPTRLSPRTFLLLFPPLPLSPSPRPVLVPLSQPFACLARDELPLPLPLSSRLSYMLIKNIIYQTQHPPPQPTPVHPSVHTVVKVRSAPAAQHCRFLKSKTVPSERVHMCMCVYVYVCTF